MTRGEWEGSATWGPAGRDVWLASSVPAGAEEKAELSAIWGVLEPARLWRWEGAGHHSDGAQRGQNLEWEGDRQRPWGGASPPTLQCAVLRAARTILPKHK